MGEGGPNRIFKSMSAPSKENHSFQMVRKPASKQFSVEEVEELLSIIKKDLPVGTDDWEDVIAKNNVISLRRNWQTRGTESLKSKFRSGYAHKKKTGDPKIPI